MEGAPVIRRPGLGSHFREPCSRWERLRAAIPELAIVRVDTTLGCSCSANRFQPHAECDGTIQPGDSEFFRLEFGTALFGLLPQLLAGQLLFTDVSEAPEMVEEFGYDPATHTAWSVFLGFSAETVWEPGDELTIEFVQFRAFDLTEGFATGVDQFISVSFSSSRRQIAEPVSGEPGAPEGTIAWTLCSTE